MDKKTVQFLRIDKEIQSLKLPLLPRDYALLEESLRTEGCKDPLITWNDTLIDGYNRYEICIRRRIPFTVLDLYFSCREAVIAWVCKTQLKRSDLSDEARRFLIGLQCESERAVGVPMMSDTPDPLFDATKASGAPRGSKMNIARRIACENDMVYASVIRNIAYAHALMSIRALAPYLFHTIYSGKLRISHDDTLELSHMSAEELDRACQVVQAAGARSFSYRKLREAMSAPNTDIAQPKSNGVSSVKDMPAYDPDAELTGLSLTIPSWTSSIARIYTKTNLNIVSDIACVKLEDVLVDLQNQVFDMLSAIRRS